MRSRIVMALCMLLLVFSSALSFSMTYRWVAIRDGDVCLIGADGKSQLVLGRGTDKFYWTGVTVSPSGDCVVAVAQKDDSKQYPYRIDPHTREMQSIPSNVRNLQLPEKPVWLDGHTTLFESFNEEKYAVSVYAVDVRTGQSALAVPAWDGESPYDHLTVSPSGRLIATGFGMTNAFWISVSALGTGKWKWRTNPENGMIAQTGMVWSPDSRSLLVSFWHDDEEFPGPGGIWRFDASTGKHTVWRHKARNVFGLWTSPDHKILAADVQDAFEFVRLSDGRVIRRVTVWKSVGDAVDCFLTNDGRFIHCGTESLLVVRLGDGSKKYCNVRPIGAEYGMVGLLSPTTHEVLYACLVNSGSTHSAGVVDTRSGKITKIEGEISCIAWLPYEIERASSP